MNRIRKLRNAGGRLLALALTLAVLISGRGNVRAAETTELGTGLAFVLTAGKENQQVASGMAAQIAVSGWPPYADAGQPKGDWVMTWSGDIESPVDGTLTLRVRADGRARLTVGGKIVADAWDRDVPREVSAPVEMKAGQRLPLRLEYRRTGGEPLVALLWEGPGWKQTLVPQRRLYPPVEPDDQTPPTAPGKAAAVLRGITWVGLSWEPSADDKLLAGYVIARDGRTVGTSIQPVFRDIGLIPGSEHVYAIRAIDTAGRLSEAAEVKASSAPAPATAALEGPYEDLKQQNIPFGMRSCYLAPWRAYMDTQPASKLLYAVGINFNVPHDARIEEASAKALSDAGFRSARVEVGPAILDFDHPDTIDPNQKKRITQRVQALARHGIRPLFLLNANAGWPVPIRQFKVRLLQDARPGDREIRVDKVDDRIRLQYTGLDGQAYQRAFPLVTAADAATGTLTLSAPLRKGIKAGELPLSTLRFHPFSGIEFEDGTQNPMAEETYQGWMSFVRELCRTAVESLGTAGRPDAGFDLEIWNEYTFGSQFLDEKNYYDPPRKFRRPFIYKAHGLEISGHQAIRPMTVDYVMDPANQLPGVKVIDGFSNQRPWESGSSMWPGQAGFSRHYYTGAEFKPVADRYAGKADGMLDALGGRDGIRDPRDWHTVFPGSCFIPNIVCSMPEWNLYGYFTEFITRDVQPFPGPWRQHHRFSWRRAFPGLARPAEVWMTETNFYRLPLAQKVMRESKVDQTDQRLRDLMMAVQAKALLRYVVFYSHKGVATMEFFCAFERNDNAFNILPAAFFEALKDRTRTAADLPPAGPPAEAIGRVTRLFKTARPLAECRPLRVESLVEHGPRIVYTGDGTPEHPDRWQRDDFAVLPFQFDERTFVIGCYVVTQNMTTDRQPAFDALDPRHYAMPEQLYTLTLSNLRGEGAEVAAWDPMTDAAVPVKVTGRGASDITVEMPATDYPRFLTVRESAPGPLVEQASLTTGKDAAVSFRSSADGRARVTWGVFPARRLAGWQAEYFPTTDFTGAPVTRRDAEIDFSFGAAAPAAGLPAQGWSARWRGMVAPVRDGRVSFRLEDRGGARLIVAGKVMIDRLGKAGPDRTAEIALKGGVPVAVTVECVRTQSPSFLRLYWTPTGGGEAIVPVECVVPPGLDPAAYEAAVDVKAGQSVRVPVPTLAPGESVRVTVESGALRAVWPRWDWDVQGVWDDGR